MFETITLKNPNKEIIIVTTAAAKPHQNEGIYYLEEKKVKDRYYEKHSKIQTYKKEKKICLKTMHKIRKT